MSAARPILIVEDDDALRQVLADQVASSGMYQSIEAATLDEASRHLGAGEARFDTIILDINLPDGDGRDFCARIRKQGHTMPIIMLTGASTEGDVVSGLNAGANDYIAKPFRVNELLARLQAQLRLFDTSEDAVFTIGPYTFRPAAKLLISVDNKQRLRLTAKEVDILKFLYRNANRVVSRQVLLDEVWGYNAGVTTHTLETHVYRLRQKIEVDPTNCRLLMTAPWRISPGSDPGLIHHNRGSARPDREAAAYGLAIPGVRPIGRGGRSEEWIMAKVHYKIVQHDGGWAYTLNGVFSEPFRDKLTAVAAARRVAAEQRIPGDTTQIEFQDGDGRWHTELAEGDDRPEADVEL